MISEILTVLFQAVMTILFIKLYHDFIISKYFGINKTTTDRTAMDQLEIQLALAQGRELIARERVVILEDENRALTSYVQRLRSGGVCDEGEEDGDDAGDDEPRAV